MAWWAQIADTVLPAAPAAPLALMRTLGAFALIPLLPETLPRHIRLAVPVALWPLIMASPLVVPAAQQAPSLAVLMAWLLAEFAIGALIALPAGIVFWAAQSAGELVDIKTGANNTATFGTGQGAPDGPAQIFMSQLAVVAFISAGGPLLIVEALLASYRLVPAGDYGPLLLQNLPQFATEIAAGLFKATFTLFGPFFAFFLLVEFGLGMAGKMSQQLQIGTITAPAKSLLFALIALLLLMQGSWFTGPAAFSVQGMQHALDWLTR